ncbi:WD40-repeat-containing domain protein [Dichotomocladium elegans]|nr:WD40-repeat-containing domain protein [Dichotomocladium elegans]
MCDSPGSASSASSSTHSPPKCASAPPIPPKPTTTTNPIFSPPSRLPLPPSSPPDIPISPPTLEAHQDEQRLLKDVNRVSLITQQFENFKVDQLARHDIISDSPKAEDPFSNGEEEDEEITSSDSSSSFSSSSSSSDDGETTSDESNSSDEAVDDSLVQQIHMRYHGVIRTPPPPPPPLPKSADDVQSNKTPPPPPPPSKKYHSIARSTASSMIDIPSSAVKMCSDNTISASPPSLPPRPTVRHSETVPMSLHESNNSMPSLPPRPALNMPTRSHTINIGSPAISTLATSQLPRSQSMKKAYMSLSQIQQAKSIYPDFSTASRRKPYIYHEKRIPTGHRGTIRALAVSGSCVATGSHETRIWNTETSRCLYLIDAATPDDANDRVTSLEFAPTRDPCDEGKYLWIGHKDGQIMVADTSTGRLISRPQSTHQHAITWMLRYKNRELWTIDEGGTLNIWDTYDVRLVDESPVLGNVVAALLRDRDLWMANVRTIAVFPGLNSEELKRTRIPNDLGNITALATLALHPGVIFCAHDNGKVSVWDMSMLERIETVTVSMYGITSMVAVGDYYLWMGYNTGMIYVYDTRPERWRVIKQFKAHECAIVRLSVDSIGIALGDNTVQVVSADSHGGIAFWNGLIPDYWHGKRQDALRI